jgi:parallel beta-helix repeat protein
MKIRNTHMKRKIFSIFFILALVLSLNMVTAVPVAADPGTIYVPGNYPTIQAAVDAAGVGDTVEVSGGPYTEDVFISQSTGHFRDNITVRAAGAVTLNGGFILQSQNYPTPGACGPGPSGVTIEGFTINGGAMFGSHEVGVAVRADGTTIKNNTIENVTGHAQCRPIETVVGQCNNLLVEGNIIRNNQNSIYLNPSTGVTFRRNLFQTTGLGGDGWTDFLAEYNIFDGCSMGGGPGLVNVVVRYNDFINNTDRALTWWGGDDILAENNWWGSINGPNDAIGTTEVALGDADPGTELLLNAEPVGQLGARVSDAVDWVPQNGSQHIDYFPWSSAPNGIVLTVADVKGQTGELVQLQVTLTTGGNPVSGKSISCR